MEQRRGYSDRDLWRRVAHGDDRAFADIYDRHHRAVYNYVFRRTAQWSVAEDLLSATFLEAWRRRGTVELQGESALPWLLGVATNLLRNRWRSLARQRRAFDRLPPQAAADPATDGLAGRLDDQRRMALVLDKLDHLSARDREVIALRAFAHQSYEEIAETLGVPVGTVRSRLSRARRQLHALCGDAGTVSEART